MFVMAKKFKELFASTLNGITASVRCVSSVIVVLNAKLAQLITAHANKKPKEGPLLLVETHTVHILYCVRKNESIIYFPTIYASE